MKSTGDPTLHFPHSELRVLSRLFPVEGLTKERPEGKEQALKEEEDRP